VCTDYDAQHVSAKSQIENEIEILAQLPQDSYFVRLIGDYRYDGQTHVVMELCGRDLFEIVCGSGGSGPLPEKNARAVLFEMLVAVDELHACGIVHRDLKLENWTYSDAAGLRLIDFGTACHHTEPMRGSCGSSSYIAPEVLQKNYIGGSCDMWSLGCILYILLCGYSPFFGECYMELKHSIMRDALDFSKTDHWEAVSPAAKDLIQLLLTKDAKKRPTAPEALQHPWFCEPTESNAAVSATPVHAKAADDPGTNPSGREAIQHRLVECH
jgi:serine/threonine protein kinase